MGRDFQAGGFPTLIGSLPLTQHGEASDLVFRYTPEIPVWVQLPANAHEGMIAQFLPGMPGWTAEAGREFVDTRSRTYSDALLRFYEEYLAVCENGPDVGDSRFGLQPERAPGFFTLLERLKELAHPPRAVKGQITGPVTFTTGVRDQDDRAIFYHEECRDAAVKLLALKARWQTRRLSEFKRPVILFLDEPALAGFGSSEMISISRSQVAGALREVVDAVHLENGLAGIHVCANTDWSLALDGGFDIVNFDAYAYFDRFVLYADSIRRFVGNGGVLAWGIVPTLSPEALDQETSASLLAKWEGQVAEMLALGIERTVLLHQSLITPSCGAGSLDRKRAIRVLELTRAVSDAARESIWKT